MLIGGLWKKRMHKCANVEVRVSLQLRLKLELWLGLRLGFHISHPHFTHCLTQALCAVVPIKTFVNNVKKRKLTHSELCTEFTHKRHKYAI